MRAACLAVALLVVPTAAAALSCVRPDPVARFEQAREDAAAWMVIDGVIDFDAARLPNRGMAARAGRTDVAIPARIEGRALTVDGFTAPVLGAAVIEASCAGPWCPAAAPGRHLIFARVAEDGTLRIALGPCPGEITPDPDASVLRAIETCMAGEPCRDPR